MEKDKKETTHLFQFLHKSKFTNQDTVHKSESTATTIDIPSYEPSELKTYPQAWFALFLLVLLRTAVSVFQYTFSVIPDMTGEYFNVSLSTVNWYANIQCIVYVIMSCFTGIIFEKLGVKRSILVSGFLLALGSALRFFSTLTNPPSYILSMAGQIIGGSASPLALNIMTMFASTWFTENLRATAGMFVASNYGAILVMFVIPAIANKVSDIPFVLSLVTGFCVFTFITLFFMPAKPPTPPTRVQDSDRPPFFKGLKMLSKNLGFWIIFLIQSLNVGMSIAFCALYAQIISPHGYSNTDAGQLNAIAFFAGTLGCSVAGPVLDLTKQYKLFLKLTAPMILVTDIAFIFLIQKDSYASVLFVTALNQFFISFLVPVAIETGSETSYPVAEATTNSILWQGAQLFGFIFVLVMDATRSATGVPANNMTNALIIQAAVAGLITLLSFVFNGKMSRSEASQLEDTIEENKETKIDDDKPTYRKPYVIGINLVDSDSLES